MKTTLPPPRELPAHRHEQIRETIVRTVEGRSAKAGGLRRPALIATAAAGAVVLAVSIITWQFGGGEGPSARVPVAGGAGETAIERGCRESTEDHRIYPGKLRMHGLIDDAAGRYALLYAGGTKPPLALGCYLWGDGTFLAGERPVLSMKRLPDQLSVEFSDTADLDTHVVEMVAGRVTGEVTRVTYHNNEATTEALLMSGTFIVRVLHPAGTAASSEMTHGEVRAYDTDGTLVAQASGGDALNSGCPPNTSCEATVPWK